MTAHKNFTLRNIVKTADELNEAGFGRASAAEDTDRALAHLQKAGELAEPDRILSPFVEFHSLLNGLDKTAFGDGPLYRSILNVWYGYRAGWSEIHAHQTKANLSRLLSDSEREMAKLAAQGMANPAIAQALGVSQTTVRNHLRTAMEKMGLRSRDELRAIFRTPAEHAEY